MATHLGSEGLVKVGANTVAEVLSWSVTEEAEMVEDTQLSDSAKTFVAGQTMWTAEVTCHWDETDTNGQEALTVGASVTLNLYPEGDSSTDVELTGTALVQNVGISVTGGNDVSSRSLQLQGTGALTHGTVA